MARTPNLWLPLLLGTGALLIFPQSSCVFPAPRLNGCFDPENPLQWAVVCVTMSVSLEWGVLAYAKVVDHPFLCSWAANLLSLVFADLLGIYPIYFAMLAWQDAHVPEVLVGIVAWLIYVAVAAITQYWFVAAWWGSKDATPPGRSRLWRAVVASNALIYGLVGFLGWLSSRGSRSVSGDPANRPGAA